MEFGLFNMDEDIEVREPVIISTFDPGGWDIVFKITVAIRIKMLNRIKQTGLTTLRKPHYAIASLPPDGDDCGASFYVKAYAYAVLKDEFNEIVWECIHDEVASSQDS
jgi:hypothetical protein